MYNCFFGTVKGAEMRLIDADEFKKYISNMPLTNASKEMFKNAIKAQPTAYDIDKVVEELLQCTACSGHKDHEKQCGGCAGCLDCKLEDAYYIAIKIVKQGLKEQNK